MFFMQVLFGLVLGVATLGSMTFTVINAHAHTRGTRREHHAD